VLQQLEPGSQLRHGRPALVQVQLQRVVQVEPGEHEQQGSSLIAQSCTVSTVLVPRSFLVIAEVPPTANLASVRLVEQALCPETRRLEVGWEPHRGCNPIVVVTTFWCKK